MVPGGLRPLSGTRFGVRTEAAPCCVPGLRSVGVPWAHACQHLLNAAVQVCWDQVRAAAACWSRRPGDSCEPFLGALAFSLECPHYVFLYL